MKKWMPVEVSATDLIFGPRDINKMMPAYHEIPSEFYDRSNKWHDVFGHWFFTGLPEGTEFLPKEGIDLSKALAHIRSVMGSFEPKHEHKMAGVAFLMNEWFQDVIVPVAIPSYTQQAQAGYTLFEMVATLLGVAAIGVFCFLLYSAAHFISKAW